MNEQDIFLQVLRHSDSAQRFAYLDVACKGQPKLRQRVEVLLGAHERAGHFLESPAAGEVATLDSPLMERPGTIIGPYKLLQQIGEGGMGVVYMADQEEPVRRRVALKIIKPGMDSRQVIARFEAERQALAMMDHQNIARVLDAGTTESGRPYFVMELVHGVPLTRFCNDNRLTLRQRLDLFVAVCHAIQHAHQKGVIHRDIKPGNILVTMYDDKPVPKVIDFGVAKAVEQRLTDKTLFTQFGMLVGTFEYMSPEQAEMNAYGVDTRSDVYSLGVLLYELLTGTTPLDHKRLREAALAELVRLIKEEEPPRPSVRLSTSATLPKVAAACQTEPARLSQLVRGELDWIVMKCLEKDRTRRYETANGLARDVERFLADEPVQACPPSASYRLRKFARRNKGPVLVAAGIFFSLIVGIIGTTAGLMEARRERDAAQTARHDAVAAQQAEAEQRRIAQDNARKAVAAAKAEKQAKETAEAREAETRAVLNFVEKKVLAAARPEGWFGGLGHDVSLRQAVEAALPYVEESFTTQPLTEARLRNTLGTSFWFLGDAKRAAEQFEKALPINSQHRGPNHPETLHSMHGLALSYNTLGQWSKALPIAEKTLALRKARLGPNHSDTLWSMHDLASSYNGLGRHADALKLNEEALTLRKATLGPDHPDTLASMGLVGVSYSFMGRREEALELHKETLRLRTAKLGPDHPDTLWSMGCVADTHAGGPAESLKLSEEASALMEARLGPNHPHTLWSIACLANKYAALGRYADALKLDEKTLEHRKAKLGPDHPDTLASMILLALDYTALDRHDETLKLREEALALMEARHGPDHPETLRTRNHLALILNYQAWRLVTCPEATRYSQRAVALAREAVELAPKSGDIRNTLGAAYCRAGDWKAAIGALQKAEELNHGTHFSLNAFFLAMAHWHFGDKEQAQKWYTAGLMWMAKYSAKSAELQQFRKEAGVLVGLPEKLSQPETAAKDYNVKLYTLITELEPSAAWAWQGRSAARAELEQYDLAAEDLAEAIELGQEDYLPWYNLALMRLADGKIDGYQAACAELLERFSDTNDTPTANFVAWTCVLAPKAVSDLGPALVLAERAVQADPNSPQYVSILGAIHFRAGRLDEAAAKLEEADRLAKKADKLLTSPAYTWFFLAMAQQRLGHPDQARQWLGKAVKHTDQELKEHREGTDRVPWNRRLTLRLLRSEAEELIGMGGK